MADTNAPPKNTPDVAFIGLGSMGLGMAKNLLKHGHKVIGVDRSPAAREAFAQAGGTTAATPAEAAANADVVMLAVVNAAQVDAVLFGDGGAVAALHKGGLVMQCATVPPAFSKSLGERLAKSGHVLLDAPMSGGRARAETGELTYMTSGSAAAYAAAESILAATSAKVFRLGEAPGIGSLVKTVNQLLAGVHIAAAAEAMALAAKAGADTRAVYDVISASAGNSWMFGNRVPHMLDDDFSPLSAVEIFVKDLGLVLNTGHEQRLPLPMAAAAHQLFLAAAGAGWGKLDDAAVVKVYEQAGDFKVSSPKR
ncbi:MAG TPA: L-threonate dehydrogenase [Reyranella sp.]|nr:L-threonate dehydrogenase [Reyranella sp.]